MIMSYIWTAMAAAAFLYGAARGTGAAVSSAAMEGAEAALKFTLSTGGAICLWCGVTEVMSRCGISEWISKLLHPVLSRLFPKAAKDRETMDALSANVSANLLGLGNAATPMGIKAARGMAARCGGVASNELAPLWCSTPPPSSCCPPPPRRCGRPAGRRRPLTSSRPCG